VKKVKLKYEFLVTGIYPFDGDYQKGEYVLKKNTIDEKKFETHIKGDILYINPIIGYCSYPFNGQNVYLTFEKEVVTEIDISDYNETEKISEFINKIDLLKESKNLEQMLVLEINNSIIFPIKMLKVYDLDNNYLTMNINFSKLNVPSLINFEQTYSMEKIERQNNRITFGFNYDLLTELKEKNNLFARALSLYYSSFIANDYNIGFILLITALETLFNRATYSKVEKCKSCSQLIYEIASSVSNNVSLILMDESETIKKVIKEKYKKRSKYLHGEKVEITSKEDQELQEYVRKVLLMYWYIFINIKTNEHKSIIAEFQKQDYKTKLTYISFLKVLELKTFDEKKDDILQAFIK